MTCHAGVMSDPKADIAAVFDCAADDYGRQPTDFFTPAGRRLVELAAVSPGDRVIDVGAGAGAATMPAAEAVGTTGRVLAVDLAPRMVARIAADVRARGWTHVDAVVGDAEDPQGSAELYDVVLAGFVLFFLPDVEAALRRYRGALAPGGRLAASWFGGDDERWRPVIAAVAAFAPAPDADGEAQEPGRPAAFADISAFERSLADAGFTDMRTVEESVELRFPDGDAWCDWSWSHGMRALWESVPEQSRGEARRAGSAAVSGLVDETGQPRLQINLRYTTATKPAAVA